MSVEVITVAQAQQKFHRADLRHDGASAYPDYPDAEGGVWTPVFFDKPGSRLLGYRKRKPSDFVRRGRPTERLSLMSESVEATADRGPKAGL